MWPRGHKKRNRRFSSPEDEAAELWHGRQQQLRLLSLLVAGVLGFLGFAFMLFKILDQVSEPPRRQKHQDSQARWRGGPMATYRLCLRPVPHGGPRMVRSPLTCDLCGERLGEVYAERSMRGIPMALAIALWPELRTTIKQHEVKCPGATQAHGAQLRVAGPSESRLPARVGDV